MNHLLSFLKQARRKQDVPARAILLVVLEGQHDIAFLTRISRLRHAADATLPDLLALEREERLIFVPAGGGDFRPWLLRLGPLGCNEFHLYDREAPPVTEERLLWAARINARPRCQAIVTQKRSLENYLHPAAIAEASGLHLQFGDTDDVAELAASAAFGNRGADVAWEALPSRARRRLRNQAKGWLNTVAADRMTLTRLAERDPADEIGGWLVAIAGLVGRSV
jgi:hypothetical protein